jgi:hypothetical protein
MTEVPTTKPEMLKLVYGIVANGGLSPIALRVMSSAPRLPFSLQFLRTLPKGGQILSNAFVAFSANSFGPTPVAETAQVYSTILGNQPSETIRAINLGDC